jgi:hypothetical protein
MRFIIKGYASYPQCYPQLQADPDTNLSFRGKRATSSGNNGLHIALGAISFFHKMSPTRRSARAAQVTHMPIRLVVANSESSYLATDAGIRGGVRDTWLAARRWLRPWMLSPVRCHRLPVTAVDRHLGHHVAGIAKESGAIEWSFGRRRGLEI